MTKNQKTIFISLIAIFLTIAFLIMNENSIVLNLDNLIHNWISNHQYPVIYNTMLSITSIGDVLGVVIIFLIFGLFLFYKNPSIKNGAIRIFTLSAVFGVMFTETIKHLVQRIRPYNLLEQSFSFPSAHAMISTVFLLSSIFLIAPLIEKRILKNTFLIIVSIVLPLVTFSRIYLSVHYTSDVIAGVILGSICYIFVEIVCCQKKENVL